MPPYLSVPVTDCACCGDDTSIVVPGICTGQASGYSLYTQPFSPGEFESTFGVSPDLCFSVSGPTGTSILVAYQHPASIPVTATITSVSATVYSTDAVSGIGVAAGIMDQFFNLVGGSYSGPYSQYMSFAAGWNDLPGYVGGTHFFTPLPGVLASSPVYFFFYVDYVQYPTFGLEVCDLVWTYTYPC